MSAEADWHTVQRGPSVPKRVQGSQQNSQKRPIVLICCGLVGSGKSTVAASIEEFFPDQWCRANQDQLRSRQNVELKVRDALRQGLNVIVDRTNATVEQRQTWIDLAHEYDAEVVVFAFDTPFQECYRRLQHRTDHPTLKTPQKAMDVLFQFSRQLTFPTSNAPGISRLLLITPAEYSALPTFAEISRILERIAVESFPTRDSIHAAQLRTRPPPGFVRPEASRSSHRGGGTRSSWSRGPYQRRNEETPTTQARLTSSSGRLAHTFDARTAQPRSYAAASAPPAGPYSSSLSTSRPDASGYQPRR